METSIMKYYKDKGHSLENIVLNHGIDAFEYITKFVKLVPVRQGDGEIELDATYYAFRGPSGDDLRHASFVLR